MEAEEFDRMRVFRNMASLSNCGIIILTLSSYGIFLPSLTFWVCWSILVIESVVMYAIRPYWIWIAKSPNLSHTGRGRTICVKVGLSIALIVMLVREHDFKKRQNKILFLTSVSIIIFEGFMHIGIIREKNKSYVQNQRVENLLMVSKKKQNLYVNVAALLILSAMKQYFDWNAVTLLIPSAISVMISLTGAIVLGGKLGNMLCDKLYWILISMFVVDLIAEAIQRFDCGNRSLFDPFPQTLPKRHYVANILRVSVEGFLCYSMIVEISGNPYYVDVKVCEAECQERSRSMLMTMMVLSGIQATVAFAIPLCSRVLCIFTGDTETEVNSPSQP